MNAVERECSIAAGAHCMATGENGNNDPGTWSYVEPHKVQSDQVRIAIRHQKRKNKGKNKCKEAIDRGNIPHWLAPTMSQEDLMGPNPTESTQASPSQWVSWLWIDHSDASCNYYVPQRSAKSEAGDHRSGVVHDLAVIIYSNCPSTK